MECGWRSSRVRFAQRSIAVRAVKPRESPRVASLVSKSIWVPGSVSLTASSTRLSPDPRRRGSPPVRPIRRGGVRMCWIVDKACSISQESSWGVGGCEHIRHRLLQRFVRKIVWCVSDSRKSTDTLPSLRSRLTTSPGSSNSLSTAHTLQRPACINRATASRSPTALMSTAYRSCSHHSVASSSRLTTLRTLPSRTSNVASTDLIHAPAARSSAPRCGTDPSAKAQRSGAS